MFLAKTAWGGSMMLAIHIPAAEECTARVCLVGTFLGGDIERTSNGIPPLAY